MPAFRNLFNPTATRLLLALLLVGFLAVHGHAGAVRQVLGSSHRHDNRPPAPAATSLHLQDGLAALRAWWLGHQAHARTHPHPHPQQDARAHRTTWPVPDHRHSAFERHHHDIGDETVVALDDGGAAGRGGADGTPTAPAGGAELPPGLARAPDLPAVPGSAIAWPTAQARTWQNALTLLPERPPRA